MRFGVLGTDPDLLRLLAAAIDEGHEIVWIGDVRREDTDTISRLVPQLVDGTNEWELLLDRATADGVLIGSGNELPELRAEQLKRLAAEAMPLLVVHPAFDSVLPYYEVDMTRRETGGIVRHYNPAAGHTIFAELAAWARDSHPTIGTVYQVTCDRRVQDSSRESVQSQLARDAEPLAVVAGDIRRVSAIGPIRGEGSFASLQVQMTCDAIASARWSVGSLIGSQHDMEMTLVGERGTLKLRSAGKLHAAEQSSSELELKTADESEIRILDEHDGAQVAVRQFADVIAARSPDRSTASTWDAATRAMEVVDAVELSLEKNRTVDVQQQQLTERLAFRGMMSALGCGLLLIGFLALVVVTIFGGAEGEGRAKLLTSWPAILLAVLALFLLLQLVPLLITQRPRQDQTADDNRRGNEAG